MHRLVKDIVDLVLMSCHVTYMAGHENQVHNVLDTGLWPVVSFFSPAGFVAESQSILLSYLLLIINVNKK